ncbi:hypothetical protein BDW68DRAFT_149792 [Aspergillus falconensis]
MYKLIGGPSPSSILSSSHRREGPRARCFLLSPSSFRGSYEGCLPVDQISIRFAGVGVHVEILIFDLRVVPVVICKEGKACIIGELRDTRIVGEQVAVEILGRYECPVVAHSYCHDNRQQCTLGSSITIVKLAMAICPRGKSGGIFWVDGAIGPVEKHVHYVLGTNCFHLSLGQTQG